MSFLKFLKNPKLWRSIVRIFGRAIDDFDPGILTVIGLLITVAPGIFMNLRAKNTLTRIAATFLIDLSAFFLGDVAGEATGAGVSMAVPIAETALLGITLGADIGSSVAWDGFADKKDWDNRLDNWLQSLSPKTKSVLQKVLGRQNNPAIPQVGRTGNSPVPSTGYAEILETNVVLETHPSTAEAPSTHEVPMLFREDGDNHQTRNYKTI